MTEYFIIDRLYGHVGLASNLWEHSSSFLHLNLVQRYIFQFTMKIIMDRIEMKRYVQFDSCFKQICHLNFWSLLLFARNPVLSLSFTSSLAHQVLTEILD